MADANLLGEEDSSLRFRKTDDESDKEKGDRKRTTYAALDLGTNSCRMLIAEPAGETFKVLDAFAKSVRLGEGLTVSGRISEDSIKRSINALKICSSKLRRHKVKRMRLVTTEAVRQATNGADFLRRVRNQTGLRLELIRPIEEARLAVISCGQLARRDCNNLLVVDIGGGSTEMVWLDISDIPIGHRRKALANLKIGSNTDGVPTLRSRRSNLIYHAKVVDWMSVPLGVSTLYEQFNDVSDEKARFALMSCHFEQKLEEFVPYNLIDEAVNAQNFQIIGTSGTFSTVGSYFLGLERYDRKRVDGMEMTAAEVENIISVFLNLGLKGRQNDPRIGRDRASLILSGAAIMQTLLRIWPCDHLSIADRGLREGMLYSMMMRDNVLKANK